MEQTKTQRKLAKKKEEALPKECNEGKMYEGQTLDKNKIKSERDKFFEKLSPVEKENFLAIERLAEDTDKAWNHIENFINENNEDPRIVTALKIQNKIKKEKPLYFSPAIFFLLGAICADSEREHIQAMEDHLDSIETKSGIQLVSNGIDIRGTQ